MTAQISPNNEITAQLTLPGLSVDNRPTFAELSYDEIVGHLEQYYNQLRSFITEPGVIRYDQLVSLRRRVVSVELAQTNYNRCQAQLRLATDLLRLGRRQEGYALLKDLEESLLETKTAPRSRCYLLWLALVRAAIGKNQSAFYLALNISAQAINPALDAQLVSFFRTLHSPMAAIAS